MGCQSLTRPRELSSAQSCTACCSSANTTSRSSVTAKRTHRAETGGDCRAQLLSLFFIFKHRFNNLFLAVLGLHFCVRAFSSCGKRGPLFIAMRGPLLLRSTGSRRAGSVVVAHGPSCSAACGIFPDRGSNPCPLHWQADSQPLRHQGSPIYQYLLEDRKSTRLNSSH